MMKPYANSDLTRKQRIFHYRQSRATCFAAAVALQNCFIDGYTVEAACSMVGNEVCSTKLPYC
ncbi:hypothetical protein DPMN_084131 [Dreissena polymorpha]|uniref:Uncharacterized protein n=1 Tax=Dreissena polymorpha TaxID=45954 RepID=A0A9D4BIB0_DREPO|nr:hypothetical protein DPMN_084131 [Dreissena polymorpha]